MNQKEAIKKINNLSVPAFDVEDDGNGTTIHLPLIHKDNVLGIIHEIDEIISEREAMFGSSPSKNDAIKPTHYQRGKDDLISMWARIYSEEEFIAIMSSHIQKYLYRDKENKLQDLKKAEEYIKRLIEELEENAE